MNPETILIFDQEEVIRDSLRLILSDEGFECYIAQNRQKMDDILAHRPIDMLIIDSQNVGDGLVRRLKKASQKCMCSF